ncbi:MAG: hypothetical protein LBQ64_01070 [Bacteroidales bacterium]|jgi:hypothetical protein|nr:hypothetical protein [Bacteroidales bacterium]
MNDFTLFTKTSEDILYIVTPRKQIIQNILDYSKIMQVRKTKKGKTLFFMNN